RKKKKGRAKLTSKPDIKVLQNAHYARCLHLHRHPTRSPRLIDRRGPELGQPRPDIIRRPVKVPVARQRLVRLGAGQPQAGKAGQRDLLLLLRFRLAAPSVGTLAPTAPATPAAALPTVQLSGHQSAEKS